MRIYPVAGRLVRDPFTMEPVPADGRDVPDGDLFYARALADGDVSPFPAAAVPDASPVPAAAPGVPAPSSKGDR